MFPIKDPSESLHAGGHSGIGTSFLSGKGDRVLMVFQAEVVRIIGLHD
jgi:hypothetical protein